MNVFFGTSVWSVWPGRFGLPPGVSLAWFSVRFLSGRIFWNFGCGLCGFGALALTARLSLARVIVFWCFGCVVCVCFFLFLVSCLSGRIFWNFGCGLCGLCALVRYAFLFVFCVLVFVFIVSFLSVGIFLRFFILVFGMCALI